MNFQEGSLTLAAENVESRVSVLSSLALDVSAGVLLLMWTGVSSLSLDIISGVAAPSWLLNNEKILNGELE